MKKKKCRIKGILMFQLEEKSFFCSKLYSDETDGTFVSKVLKIQFNKTTKLKYKYIRNVQRGGGGHRQHMENHDFFTMCFIPNFLNFDPIFFGFVPNS